MDPRQFLATPPIPLARPQQPEAFSAADFEPVANADFSAADFEPVTSTGFSASDFEYEGPGFVERYITGPLIRGKNQQLDQSANMAGYGLGVLSVEQFADAILSDMADAAKYPRHREDEAGLKAITGAADAAVPLAEAQRLQAEQDALAEQGGPEFFDALLHKRKANADRNMAVLGAAWDNAGAIPVVAAESAPSIATSVGAGIVGGKVGGVAGSVAGPVGSTVGAATGAATGMGLASGSTDFVTSVIGKLEENNKTVDRETLIAALNDPEFMAEAYDYAIKRGLSVGVFDALGAGVAGRVAGPVSRAVGGGASGRVAGVSGEAAVQSVTGGSGEAAAQIASEGAIVNPGEVLLEAAAEIPGSALEVPGAILARGDKLGQTDFKASDFEPAQNPAQVATVDTKVDPNAAQQVAPVQPQQPAAAPQVQPEVNSQGESPAPSPEPAPVQTQAPEPVATPAPAPAPAQTPAPAPAQTPARAERVITPDGKTEVDTEFTVIDADELRSAEGELQPRDRAGRIGSDEQVRNIANNLDPLRLMNSRESDRGAPIIDEGNTVLSGNGRVAAIIAASQTNPQGYAAYRASLEQQGHRTDGIKTPVLVRRAVNLTPDQKKAFAVGSNRRGGMAFSPSEQARIDADSVSPDMLNSFDVDAEGGVSAATNSAFVRQFMARIPQEERNELTDKNGALTPAGVRRISAALFARAFGDKRLIERAVEEGQDPAISNALSGAAAAWARMREAIKDRANSKDFDLTEKLVGALELVGQARSAGMSFRNYIAQQDAFSQTDEDVIEVARMLHNPQGTRLAAWRDIRDRLIAYADEVTRANSGADTDMFGGGPATGMDIVRGGNRKRGSGNDNTSVDPDPTTPAPAAANQNGGELFSGSETTSTGPARPRRVAKLQAPNGPTLFERSGGKGFDPDADVFQDAETQESKEPMLKSAGRLTPGMHEVSFTDRRSVYEDAYRVAGLDPDRGITLPPVQQRNILARVLRNTFGFAVDLSSKLSTLEAQNQMLDAYRNVRFMMSVLNLPIKAVSLSGRVTLALERYRGAYLGAYDPSSHTIHMPGRSNSFAHEWMHALDHFLLDTLRPTSQAQLLSQATRSEGLDPTSDIQASFVNLVHALMFDDASIALNALRLEREASAVVTKGPRAGKPTKAAVEAQAQLDRLLAGATRIKIASSEMRKNSQKYGLVTGGPNSAAYFGSVHEMIARAFEAWIAHKVALAGGTNEFITKGDQAYLSDADARLAMTFPKADERVRIFAAFEHLFDHIRKQSLLGTGPAAQQPDNSDTYDAQRYNHEMATAPAESWNAEISAAVNRVRNWFTNPGTMLRTTVSTAAIRAGIRMDQTAKEFTSEQLSALTRAVQYIIGAQRGALKMAVARATGTGDKILQSIVDKVVTDPGSGREVGAIYEAERDRAANQFLHRIDAALDRIRRKGFFGRVSGAAKDLARGDFAQHMPKEDNDIVREIMFGNDPKGATAEHFTLAGEVRRVMTDAYMAAKAAGLDIGFVENTGYLNRVVDTQAVENDPENFVKAATEVYGIKFDELTADIDPTDAVKLALEVARAVQPGAAKARYKTEIKALRAALKALRNVQAANAQNPDPNAVAAAENDVDVALDDLLAAVKPDYALNAAEDWRTRIIAGDSFAYDSHGPGMGNINKPRTLPKEADKIMSDFYDTDVLHLAVNYVRRLSAHTAYARRFGNSSGNVDVRAVLNRKANAPRARSSRYDPSTQQGVINIINELADPKVDNLLEMGLQSAGRLGAPSESIRDVRSGVQNITGRGNTGAHHGVYSRISAGVYVYGIIRTLVRSAWSSLTEPLAAYMQTQDVKLAFKTLGRTLSEIRFKSDSIRQRAALARAIGLIDSTISETVTSNRLGGDFGTPGNDSPLLNTFMRATGQPQLTNAQRRAAMMTGYEWIANLAAKVRAAEDRLAGKTSGSKWNRVTALLGMDDDVVTKADAAKARAELRELGIPEAHLEEFIDTVIAKPDAPLDLKDLDGAFETLRTRAVQRFVDQVITNPRRGDKPVWANSNYGRLVIALMSFLYAFSRLTYGRALSSGRRNYGIYREAGAGKAVAAARSVVGESGRLAVGFSLLIAGQMLVSIVREYLFSPEQWEEKERKGELDDWLFDLALSRSGVKGPLDLPSNLLTGLRYERDLSSLTAGVPVGLLLSDVQNIAKWFGDVRNSEKNNTVERGAAKALYSIAAAPLLTAALSATPVAGPLGWGLRYAAMNAVSSRGASSFAADVIAGEAQKSR